MGVIEPIRAEADRFIQQQDDRPYVTLSYAQSLDGCLATRDGRPYALSGDEALHLTHSLRAAHQAILVGVGTVISDDPLLTVRLVNGESPQAVIVDTNLRTPLNSRLIARGHHLPWLAARSNVDEACRQTFEAVGCKVLRCSMDEGGYILLPDLLSQLRRLGITTLMVEGGMHVITSFLLRQLVDMVGITVAPVWLGGKPSLAEEMVTHSAPDRFPLALISAPRLEPAGRDMVLWGHLKKE